MKSYEVEEVEGADAFDRQDPATASQHKGMHMLHLHVSHTSIPLSLLDRQAPNSVLPSFEREPPPPSLPSSSLPSSMAILYALVARGKTVLAEFTVRRVRRRRRRRRRRKGARGLAFAVSGDGSSPPSLLFCNRRAQAATFPPLPASSSRASGTGGCHKEAAKPGTSERGFVVVCVCVPCVGHGSLPASRPRLPYTVTCPLHIDRHAYSYFPLSLPPSI